MTMRLPSSMKIGRRRSEAPISLDVLPLRLMLSCWLLALALSSCAGSNYVMPGVQTPLFERAGEVEASALARLGASASGTGAPVDYLGQIAWSPLDGVALLGALSWIPRPPSLTDSALDAGFPLFGRASVEALYLEGGVGWYGRIGWPDSLRYEIFAGYGRGSSLSLSPTYDDAIQWFERVGGRYHRLFLQADIGEGALFPWGGPWSGADGVARRVMGGSMRAAWVWFTEFTGKAGSRARPRGLFIEPVWFLRSGFRSLQLEVQGGVGIRLFGREEMTWTYCYINLGLHASIGEW